MKPTSQSSQQSSQKDYLWLNIRELPYFRGLLRAVEARFYQEIELKAPILDMGCGDGDFASMTFDRPLDVGIDPWTGPIRKAISKNCYRLVIQGMGNDLPFKAGHFNSAISNSVLEHIPDVESVLKDIARVISPGGIFVFCVPNHNFLPNLSISNFFDRIGLKAFGNMYRRFFNSISRHYHCDPMEIWKKRLDEAGFDLQNWWNYFPPKSLHTLEWGHYFGLPSFLIHLFTRRWILVPQKWNLYLTKKIIEGNYTQDSIDPNGAYTFYIARRK